MGKKQKFHLKVSLVNVKKTASGFTFILKCLKGMFIFIGDRKTILKLVTVLRNVSLKKNIFHNVCISTTNNFTKNNSSTFILPKIFSGSSKRHQFLRIITLETFRKNCLTWVYWAKLGSANIGTWPSNSCIVSLEKVKKTQYHNYSFYWTKSDILI